MPAQHIGASWGHRQRVGQAEEKEETQLEDSLAVGQHMVYFAEDIGGSQGFAHTGPEGGTGSWGLGMEAGPSLGI